MSTEMFLILLGGFSIITSLVVEAIKNLLNVENRPTNIIAAATGLVVGGVGCIIFYVLGDLPVGMKEVIYACLMGFASSLTAAVGYDKVKQGIEQITRI